MNSLEKSGVLAPEQWPVDRLRPYENNAKIHDEEQIKKIAASIRAFGFDVPIVVDGAGVIIKGHGRWLAAQHLGMKYVPVIVRTDLTASQANASRLADNRVAQSEVDTEKLHAELEALSKDATIDLADLGFSEKELEFLTVDLGTLDESAIADDEELESSRIANAEDDLTELAEEELPVQKVLGFSKIPGSAAPVVTQFMNHIEAETGLQGAEAFIAWCRKVSHE